MKEGRRTRKGVTPGGRSYYAHTDKMGTREVTRIEIGKGAGKTNGAYHAKVKDTAYSLPSKKNSYKVSIVAASKKQAAKVVPIKKSFTKPTTKVKK